MASVAKGAVELCVIPVVPRRPLSARVSGRREALIRLNEKKWVNGTCLRYCFLDEPASWRGADDQKAAVVAAFAEWKDLGIGLEFKQTLDPKQAELRIGFEQGAGSSSYVGRDNVDYGTDPRERTMNFGWDLTTAYGRDTALHEVGHAIGFSHEHQNPRSGLIWDEANVLSYFRGPPNFWSEQKTRYNILRNLALYETDGTPWDEDSIMHYRFPAGLISVPEKYREVPLIPASGLSETDEAEARRLYPPLEPRVPTLQAFESTRIQIDPGGQLDFDLVIDYSREYTIQTFGDLDTVMVLFEDVDGEQRYLDGDDDSGTNLNATITAKLVAGRKYTLRVRLYFAEQAGEAALMLW